MSRLNYGDHFVGFVVVVVVVVVFLHCLFIHLLLFFIIADFVSPVTTTFMNSPVTCFDVDLLSDDRLEGPETLTITISSVDPTGSLTISSTDATIELTIVDDNSMLINSSMWTHIPQ